MKDKKKKLVLRDGGQKPKTKSDHYTSINIKGFRLFDDVTFKDLGRVNLFFGPNNSGKTSVLEAVFTHACGMNFTNAINTLITRRKGNTFSGYYDMGKRILSIFNKIENSRCSYTIDAYRGAENKKLSVQFAPASDLAILDPRNINKAGIDLKLDKMPIVRENSSSGEIPVFQQIQQKVLGKWENQFNGRKKEIVLSFPFMESHLDQHYLFATLDDILSHRNNGVGEISCFGSLKTYNILDDFVKDMREIFPIVNKIDLIPYPDGTMTDLVVYTEDGKVLSLSSFGDGMRRWFHILGELIVHQDSVHCIEEVDATFHHDALEKLSRGLVEYSKKYNNQLFLTTHNIEFADVFLKTLYEEKEKYFDNSVDPVRIYTLNPVKEGEKRKIEVWSMTGAEAYEKRQKFNLELR